MGAGHHMDRSDLSQADAPGEFNSISDERVFEVLGASDNKLLKALWVIDQPATSPSGDRQKLSGDKDAKEAAYLRPLPACPG